jgi:hypothetical protein
MRIVSVTPITIGTATKGKEQRDYKGRPIIYFTDDDDDDVDDNGDVEKM